MAQEKVSRLQETKKSDQQSAIANQRFRNKAKAAVEAYEAAVNKAPKVLTITQEEFEEFGKLSESAWS